LQPRAAEQLAKRALVQLSAEALAAGEVAHV
jgi:hypothetical protein